MAESATLGEMNAVLCSCGVLAVRRCDDCSAALCEGCAQTWAHERYARLCLKCMPLCDVCGDVAATRCKCYKLVCRNHLQFVPKSDYPSRNPSDPLESGYEWECTECATRSLTPKPIPKVESSEEFLSRFVRLTNEAGYPGIEDFYKIGARRFAKPSSRGWSFRTMSIDDAARPAPSKSFHAITTDCGLYLIHPMGRNRWSLSARPFDFVTTSVREGAIEMAERLGVTIHE